MNGLFDNEWGAFDVYFASVTSMQFHPGAGTKEHTALSLQECKDTAMDMIRIRREIALASHIESKG